MSDAEILSDASSNTRARSTAEAVARRSYGKLVAFLAARTRDVAQAEDALSEAFASALEDWPVNGCPAKPEAWLLTTARRKMIDTARRRGRGERASAGLQLLAEHMDAAIEDAEIPDLRLALMFAAAHPAIEVGIRAPLMLQVVLGLNAQTIASAYLTSPATMGKRLVRAKDKIRQAGIPFSIPQRDELAGRLDAVLDAIYAAFTEGWTDALGTDAARRDLTQEAVFLARLVSELLPEQPEALGLLALMLHAEARHDARRNAQGEYVPLAAQDPSSWNSQMIFEAEALLHRAAALGAIGRYQLEAALQSAHIHRCRTGHRTGRRWCNSTTRCSRLPARRSSPSIAPWPLRRCTAPPPLWSRCRDWKPMRGSPTTSHTGPYAPSCWQDRVNEMKRGAPTRWRSVSSATPRFAASCFGASRRCWPE